MGLKIIYLLFLGWFGFQDLRKQVVYNWQLIFFLVLAVWILLTGSTNFFNLIIHCGLFLITGILLYIYGFLGAGDVKVITLSSILILHWIEDWYFWAFLLMTFLFDIFLGHFYFYNKQDKTPFLFSWLIVNLALVLVI